MSALRHMFPRLTVPDLAYTCLANTKALCDVALQSRGGADFSDYRLGNLRATVQLPLWVEAAAFVDHVGAIGGRRTNEQVRRVHARRVIAVVADQLAFRDRTMRGNPCQAGDPPLLALPLQKAIAIRIKRSGPRPASVGATRLVGVVVEALLERPVIWALKLFRRFSSHLVTVPSWSMVRVGAAFAAQLRPAFPSISAQGGQ